MKEGMKQDWLAVWNKYGEETRGLSIFEKLWGEYNSEDRAYHNIQHIAALLKQMESCKAQIEDTDSFFFAIWFHDIVYKVLRDNNEELSALEACEFLKETNYPEDRIEKVARWIRATGRHDGGDDKDLILFLDADLSILGAAPEDYANYSAQVRKEYTVAPDIYYNAGRIKVLQHFLHKDRIFASDFFSERYEAQANINVKEELKHLEVLS